MGDFSERAQLASQAGCDMLLVCNNQTAAEQVLDTTPIEKNTLREQRLQAMQGKTAWTQQSLKQNLKWQTISQQLTELTVSYA